MDSKTQDQNRMMELDPIVSQSLSWRDSNPRVDLLIDLQFGSTGKGLIAGFLGADEQYDTCITANMPNAGHTYIDPDGNKYIFKCLPSSAVNPNMRQVLVGPGAVISLPQLWKELAQLHHDPAVRIHPNAMILHEDHAIKERKRLTHVASTAQGSAAAVVEKMWRQDRAATAKFVAKQTPSLAPYVCSVGEWEQRIEASEYMLAEGSQGFSLGINTQFYPYTTSRDCTPAAFLSAMGIPLPMLAQVIGTARTLPIRVGGTSGDCYPDQEELSWEELGLNPELTTVTQRVRRIFTYSKMQIEQAAWHCRPDYVFLNFCNYVERGYVESIVAHIDQLSDVKWLGFGPSHCDIAVCS